MDEDNEALDWGNEEDEVQDGRFQVDGREDVEDAVSLGGEDDENQEYSAYQTRTLHSSDEDYSGLAYQHDDPDSTFHQGSYDRETSHTPRQTESSRQSRRSNSIQSMPVGKLTHALPPKPVLAVPRAAPSLTSTLAGPMVSRDRRSNGLAKVENFPADPADDLPPDWEIRYPRSGGRDAPYYYNVKTHECTWTRPGVAAGGRSPSKERDSARSPERGTHDNARSQNSDRNPPTRGRRGDRRRVSSPDALTFDDRHYRPSDASASAVAAEDRGTLRARARQPSPAGADTRRLRSMSPRRDADRAGPTRRFPSRSPSPSTHGTWRDAQRDAPQSRLSPSPERERDHEWGRVRNNMPVEDTRSPSPDTRAPRSRRQRIDLSPPRHSSHAQEQNDRVDSREWSSAPHRYRSPPRETDTAPKQRRNQQARDTWKASSPPPSARNRSMSPERPTARHHDIYIPSDSIPMRRGRDFVSPDRDTETEVKRRRVDDRALNPPLPPRRAPSEQDISALPERPMSNLSLTEPDSYRKRAPLPPQSARFREASKASSSAPIPPPYQAEPGPPPPSSHSSYDAGPPTGPAAHTYADVPSGPRSFAQPPPSTESGRMPPTKPAGRRSRFDPAPQAPLPHIGSTAHAHDDRDTMDVDHLSSRQPPSNSGRTDDPPSRGGSTYSNRPAANDAQADSLPRGPKAMTSKTSQLPVPGPSPPAATYTNVRPPTEPAAAPAKMRGGRAPPPHMTQAPPQDGWGRRADPPQPPPPRGPASDTAETPTRRLEDQRDYAPDATPSRRSDTGHWDSRPPAGRDGYRHPEARQKLSVSNSTPVGVRRTAVNGPPNELPRSSLSPIEPRRPLPDDPHARYDQGHPRYPDEISPARPPVNESLDSQYRPQPPVDRDRRQSFSGQVPPPFQSPTDAIPPRPRRTSPHSQSENRPSRQSRFGPERGGEPLRSPPRVWMTREESERMQKNYQGSSNPSFHPRDADVPTSNPPMDIDDGLHRRYDIPPSRASDVQPPSPIRSADDRHYDRSTSLETRLSSRYDHPGDQYRPGPPPPSRGRSKGDIYEDQPRHGYKDELDGQRSHDEYGHVPSQNWERTGEPGPSTGAKAHPDRARFVDTPALDPPMGRDGEGSRGGVGGGGGNGGGGRGPVRLRRPPKSPTRDDTPESPRVTHGNGTAARGGSAHHEDDRPTRPAGSLLARLSSAELPMRSPSSATGPFSATSMMPSLRDRVEIASPLPKRPLDDPSLPPKPMVSVTGGDMDDNGRGRNKRRSGKPRRGRRNGGA